MNDDNIFTISSPRATFLFDAVGYLQERFDLVRIDYLPGPPIVYEATFAPPGMTAAEMKALIAKLNADDDALKQNVSPGATSGAG